MNPPLLAPVPGSQPGFFSDWHRDRGQFDGGGVGILMYHKISPPTPGTKWPSLFVHPEAFARQIADLLGATECIPYGEALTAIRQGKSGFCLTFDDGFGSVFDQALPILRLCRGARAMLFIVAGLIGGTDEWDHPIGEGPHLLMDDGQIREWLAAGHEIGAHTLTHPHLTRLPRARARAEIFDSKAVLEDRFGMPVRHFCYPYGEQDEAVRDLVVEAGFVDAPTAGGEGDAGVNPVDVDPFRLRRIRAETPARPHR